jgi:hypothetical protein
MMELTCGTCGHDWTYTGDLTDFTTCPQCNGSVKIPSSPQTDDKTTDYDKRIRELEGRVDSIETVVHRLAERLRRSETPPENDETEESTGTRKTVYDPTDGL